MLLFLPAFSRTPRTPGVCHGMVTPAGLWRTLLLLFQSCLLTCCGRQLGFRFLPAPPAVFRLGPRSRRGVLPGCSCRSRWQQCSFVAAPFVPPCWRPCLSFLLPQRLLRLPTCKWRRFDLRCVRRQHRCFRRLAPARIRAVFSGLHCGGSFPRQYAVGRMWVCAPRCCASIRPRKRHVLLCAPLRRYKAVQWRPCRRGAPTTVFQRLLCNASARSSPRSRFVCEAAVTASRSSRTRL